MTKVTRATTISGPHQLQPSACRYGNAVRTPEGKEPRAPAIAIWTLTGAFVGLAGGVVLSNVPLFVVIFAVVGLLYGFYTTRPKQTPDDD